MENQRSTILRALVEDTLAHITLANGYSCDMGLSVRWWDDLDQEYRQDAILVRDTTDEITEVNNFHQHSLQIEIEAFRWVASEPGLVASLMVQDLMKAIGANRTLNGQAQRLRINDVATSCETEGSTVCSVLLTLTVEWHTPLFQT